MIETEGTVKDLYRLREAAREIERVTSIMKDSGLPHGELRDTLATLLETVVVLQVPCILCKAAFPVQAPVNGNSLPECVLCKDCDDEVNEELGIKR